MWGSPHARSHPQVTIFFYGDFNHPQIESCLWHGRPCLAIFSGESPWNFALKNALYIVGTSNLGSWNGHWLLFHWPAILGYPGVPVFWLIATGSWKQSTGGWLVSWCVALVSRCCLFEEFGLKPPNSTGMSSCFPLNIFLAWRYTPFLETPFTVIIVLWVDDWLYMAVYFLFSC